MSITSAIAIYFVVWWLTLFLVLPFGIRSQGEEGEHAPGTDPGAPVVSRMAWRLLWNTVLSVVLFAIGVLAYRNGYFNLDMLSRLMGLPF
jgi:predicted secreted protein